MKQGHGLSDWYKFCPSPAVKLSIIISGIPATFANSKHTSW